MSFIHPIDLVKRQRALTAQRAAERASARVLAHLRRSAKHGKPLSESAVKDALKAQETARTFASYAQTYTRLMEPTKDWWTPFRPPTEPTQ